MKPTALVLGGVAVIGIAVVLWRILGTATSPMATAPTDLTGVGDREIIELAQGVETGNPEAEVWLLEFADFQCPACANFAQSVKPLIDLNYIQTGKIRFVYQDFPLVNIHPHAFLAARAGRCAEELGDFWAFHDAVYQNQLRWSGVSSAASNFVGYAVETGIDRDAFEGCLRSDRHADVVSANMQLGMRLGVPGTPSLFLRQGNGMAVRVPGSDYATLAQAIEDALAATGQP